MSHRFWQGTKKNRYGRDRQSSSWEGPNGLLILFQQYVEDNQLHLQLKCILSYNLVLSKIRCRSLGIKSRKFQCYTLNCIINLHTQNAARPPEEHFSLVSANSSAIFSSRQINFLQSGRHRFLRLQVPLRSSPGPRPWAFLQGPQHLGRVVELRQSDLGLRFPNSHFLKAVTQPGQSRQSHSHLGTTTFWDGADVHISGPVTDTPRLFFNYIEQLAQTSSPQPLSSSPS